MIVTSILVRLDISTGNASSAVTHVSPEPTYHVPASDSMHLPINGTLVLSSIPQHTQGVLHDIHFSWSFILYHSIQIHLVFIALASLNSADLQSSVDVVVVQAEVGGGVGLPQTQQDNVQLSHDSTG